MRARYRYRIEPTDAQRAMLARTFGCVRVVFNDAIRYRDEAFRAGEKPSPTDVQRRVITEAKNSHDRSWLTEVASVALVQSVRDAHRAYTNFFDSMKGKRRGRKIGRPRFKSRKATRQSFRLTRNGFSIRPDGRLYIAKVGDIRVRWSRDLPSVPSSVTIIREPDGHFYASFVVEIEQTPLPLTEQEAGIDLGIAVLATVVNTNAQHTEIPNPRHISGKQRKLTRLERQKARCAKGSANRAKSCRRIARQHGRVARCRRDLHHKLAFRLIRENQAVYVEDLNIAGMLGNHRMARAISDAGWAQFVRLLEEKAEKYGRTVHKVSRWRPSSKMCSGCGQITDTMTLHVRTWTCPMCKSRHHRDRNAAQNILAAGRAERRNACGASVSPPLRKAVGDESGSTPGAV
ncbi:transposase [Lentzea sp. NPDC051838]|uniref:RNA-guided endonuclease InsQ/TnpB family protein n=1 Tax=Lentzea sp. NPDC051838 TaxID=3154849 RepID=UPI00344854A1